MREFDKSDIKSLPAMIKSLVVGEKDVIANLCNISALIYDVVPDLNWAGFYRNVDGQLILGPFQGRPACIRIPFGKGVCGTAAVSGTPLVVADVHAFKGHIACDGASRSEMVVPLYYKDGMLFGVLDLDSPLLNRFDQIADIVVAAAKEIEAVL